MASTEGWTAVVLWRELMLLGGDRVVAEVGLLVGRKGLSKVLEVLRL